MSADDSALSTQPGETPTEPGILDSPDAGLDTEVGDEPRASRSAGRARRGPAPNPPRLGEVLGERYRLTARIGSGGMGDVFRAEHVALHRPVAVKVLAPELATSEGQASRFLREARAASSVRHPNIVEITDFGTTEQGLPYFVMEHLEGQDLQLLLANEGALPWPRAHRLIDQILRALGAAHEQGIVHRDLKPANCFIVDPGGEDETVKLLDFGIAKLLEEEAQTQLTKTGAIIGTPTYMSPEQALGHAVDARTDVYSAGVILYELLSGRVPFDAPTPMAVLSHHITEPPTPLRELDGAGPVSRQLDRVVLRSLEKKPADRIQSAEAFRRALAGIDAAPSGRPAPWAWIGATAAAAAAAIALGVAAMLGVFGGGDETGPPPTVDAPVTASVENVAASTSGSGSADAGSSTGPAPDPSTGLEAEGSSTSSATGTDDDTSSAAEEPARRTRPRPRDPRPKTEPQTSARLDVLLDETIITAIRRAGRECRDHMGLARVSLPVSLDASALGKVEAVSIGKPYTSSSLGRCMKRALLKVHLPPARRGRSFEGRVELRSSG